MTLAICKDDGIGMAYSTTEVMSIEDEVEKGLSNADWEPH